MLLVLGPAILAQMLACDERRTPKPRSTDPCMALAEHAIGECMDTKGTGPVHEERVRFCTEQYVAIVHACRCELDASEIPAPDPAPNERELPEAP